MTNLTIKVITLSTLASSFLLGATPNIGDIEKQVQKPTIQKEKLSIPEVSTKEYKKPMKDSGKTIFIKNFTFSGNAHISSDTLRTLTKEYTNKDLTFTQISELTSSITKLYREKGYFVARAYLPKQKIKDDILEIDIVEGNYGEFKLNNNSLVKDSIVQGMLDDAKRDNIVSTSTLERSMLIINDTTGVQVTGADVMPGVEVGTSDFAITTQSTKKYDGYILADNYGSRYTGKNRLMVGANINSPFKIGDKLSFSGLVSEGADLTNGRVAYSAPLMSNGLSGEISYSQTNYSLIEEYESLNAKGSSKTLDATLRYPIIRTKAENLYSTVSILNKDLKDEVGSTNYTTKKNTKSIVAGLDYDKLYAISGLNAQSNVKLNLTYGSLDFDDATDEASDKAGADTNGEYSKINLDLSHNMALTKLIILESSLKMQYALGNKNLDGSEDFSIGGSNGVKVYPSGELSAENGYLFSIETKYQLPVYNSIQSSVGFFYDRGRVFMSDNTVGFESRTLQDIGIGIYPRYKNFFGKVQVAWTIDDKEVTSERNRDSKLLVQAGWVF